jgi:hypothetical protein
MSGETGEPRPSKAQIVWASAQKPGPMNETLSAFGLKSLEDLESLAEEEPELFDDLSGLLTEGVDPTE